MISPVCIVLHEFEGADITLVIQGILHQKIHIMDGIDHFCFPVIGPVLGNTGCQVPDIVFGSAGLEKFMGPFMCHILWLAAKKAKLTLR